MALTDLQRFRILPFYYPSNNKYIYQLCEVMKELKVVKKEDNFFQVIQEFLRLPKNKEHQDIIQKISFFRDEQIDYGLDILGEKESATDKTQQERCFLAAFKDTKKKAI